MSHYLLLSLMLEYVEWPAIIT